MKTLLRLAGGLVLVLSVETLAFRQHYDQTNLDSSTSGAAKATDPQLLNPWGLTRTSSSAWWVSDEKAGVSTLYNGPGEKQSLVVTIPPVDPTKTPLGSPTGVVSNTSPTDFLLHVGFPAKFIFATHDGGIAGWNPNIAILPGQHAPSTHAELTVKTKDGSGYTGLTSGSINGKRYIFAANFALGRVDVYDAGFHLHILPPPPTQTVDGITLPVNKPFVDTSLPNGFSPFNVQAVGSDIVVTYAMHEEGSVKPIGGAGFGYIDIYSTAGLLLRRLQHSDDLNAPWGVALAPLDFGRFGHDLLVGQFGAGQTTNGGGTIVAYDLSTGNIDGVLEDAEGAPIVIGGLWSIAPSNISPANADSAAAPAAQLYFTAGTNLFGYLTPVATELLQGTAQ